MLLNDVQPHKRLAFLLGVQIERHVFRGGSWADHRHRDGQRGGDGACPGELLYQFALIDSSSSRWIDPCYA